MLNLAQGFLGVDPMADHPNQKMLSPYNYVWGNPVSLTDPDGECPQCLYAFLKGAAIGASVEIGTQLVVNLVKGDNVRDAISNIDLADVGTAAVEGGLTGGSSAVKSTAAKLGILVASELIQAGIDLEFDGDSDVVGTAGSQKSFGGVLFDTTVGVVAGKVGDLSSSAMKALTNGKAVDELTQVQKELRRSMNGSNGQAVRQAKEANLEKTITGNSKVAESTGKVVGETLEEKAKEER